MLLAIDIGNTNIVCGVFREEQLVANWRLATRIDRTSDEYGIDCLNLMRHAGIEPTTISDILIASVVPNLDGVIETMCRSYYSCPISFVDGTRQDILKINYHPPTDVGADRIVNAAAAYLKYGGPLVILDFGTATTFDAVDRQGAYIGGAIVPGIRLSAEALYQKTARLPKTAITRPSVVIGQTTVDSIQTGLYYGSLFMLQGLVDLYRQELGADTRVIATGGLMDVFKPDMPWVTAFERHLTLEGLFLIHCRNQKKND